MQYSRVFTLTTSSSRPALSSPMMRQQSYFVSGMHKLLLNQLKKAASHQDGLAPDNLSLDNESVNLEALLGMIEKTYRDFEDSLQREQQKTSSNATAIEAPQAFQNPQALNTENKALQEFYDYAIKGAEIGLWEYDLASDTFNANDSFYALLDTDAPGVNAPHGIRALFRYVPTEELDSLKAQLQAFANQQRDQFESRVQVLTANNQKRWIHFRFHVLKRDSLTNKIAKVAGFAEVIDKQITYENALSKLASLNARTDITLAEKEEQVIALSNKVLGTEFGRINKLDGDEMVIVCAVGYGSDFKKHDRSARANSLCNNSLAAGGSAFAISSLSEEGYAEHPAHTKMGIESYIGVPYFVSGKLGGTICFTSTSQVQFNHFSKNFAQLVAYWLGNEIDQYRQQQALKEARNEATKASQAKTEFLASMSHEIRTPMNGIVGIINVLSETPLNFEQRELLSTLQNSSKMLMAVINDILDLSRIESGKLELEVVLFSLREAVTETIEIFKPNASQKELSLATHFADDLPTKIYGDATRVKQILSNLLSNAIKFTDRGSIQVDVSAAQRNQNTMISIAIKDTGIGISNEQMKLIFENFSQADSSMTRRYGGSGLGLSISQKLTKLMDGKLEVSSAEGVGSTFTLTFPVQQQPAQQSKEPAKAIPLAKKAREKSGSGLILLAEDIVVNQQVIRLMLEKIGHKVVIASNGKEAVEFASRRPFDLILMDVQMPVMDGLEATRQIRQLPGYDSTPIIALTANVFAEDEVKCKAAGMNEFMGKPVHLDRLRNMLSQYI